MIKFYYYVYRRIVRRASFLVGIMNEKLIENPVSNITHWKYSTDELCWGWGDQRTQSVRFYLPHRHSPIYCKFSSFSTSASQSSNVACRENKKNDGQERGKLSWGGSECEDSKGEKMCKVILNFNILHTITITITTAFFWFLSVM